MKQRLRSITATMLKRSKGSEQKSGQHHIGVLQPLHYRHLRSEILQPAAHAFKQLRFHKKTRRLESVGLIAMRFKQTYYSRVPS